MKAKASFDRACIGYDCAAGHLYCLVRLDRPPRQKRCWACSNEQSKWYAYLRVQKARANGRRERTTKYEAEVRKAERASPHDRKHCVLTGGVKKAQTIQCMYCAGMPWAREPTRFYLRSGGKFGEGIRVQIAPDWVCLKCKGAYSPEPAIERGEVLSSSMGSSARATGLRRFY